MASPILLRFKKTLNYTLRHSVELFNIILFHQIYQKKFYNLNF